MTPACVALGRGAGTQTVAASAPRVRNITADRFTLVKTSGTVLQLVGFAEDTNQLAQTV